MHAPVEKTARPLVISASRATDIPAFHMPWFMERLREGSCVRVNPFNAAQRTRILFSDCRVFVFWSKDPRPLIPHLPEIMDRGYEFYIHFTVNDYARDNLELHVPPLGTRIDTFKKLADSYGAERLIWRSDPLLVSDSLHTDALLDRINNIGREISPCTDTLVFSFLDMYAKTRRRLEKHDASLRAPVGNEIPTFLSGLCAANAAWPKQLVLAACAEEQDFSAYGIRRNACIDPERVHRLCPNDEGLQKLCGFTQDQHVFPGLRATKKDTGQRPHCRCLPSKDIGAYNSCMHFCAYCYANLSERAVRNALDKRKKGRESML